MSLSNCRSSRFTCRIQLALAILALVSAYIAQYGFDLQPCEFCLFQRYPYMAIIVFSLLALLIRSDYFRNVFIIICAGIFLLDAGIAFYHVGIEMGWITLEVECGNQVQQGLTTTRALLEALNQAPHVPCDKPALVVLGLSMAAWNMLYALSATLISLLLRQRIAENIKHS